MLQPQLPFAPFNSHQLLAGHYLQDVLPEAEHPWPPEGLDGARAELLALWDDRYDEVEQFNEAQLEDQFIKPVLAILGHTCEVQPRAGQHQPDYGFFIDDAAREAVLPADGRREYLGSGHRRW
ncbi:MAG TPA: hypothetical protein QGH10_24110 [Armatimonadota bacterium]|nr:hypothetical protein [Armatimonadota bacterium]